MTLLPPWTPFRRAEVNNILDLEKAQLGECWINSRYQVFKREKPMKNGGTLVHLSIKNRDKSSKHDWREFQRIKNELIGPEEEAVEIYPAESRLIDTCNQFHIWCIKGSIIPVGFLDREVSESSDVPGLVQRPFPEDAKPADLSRLRADRTPLARFISPDDVG